MFSKPSNSTPADPVREAVGLASEIADQYELTSVVPLLAACRAGLRCNDIPIAVIGRFKAGKSSFLNHLLGRSILPVGVVPVTTVVTEIRFGATERVLVRFEDGGRTEAQLSDVAGFVSEQQNPGNQKRVAGIEVELPSLAEFDGLVFVDTPGLESALEHNTEASLDWLPNIGLALVAVSVDPPLSQRDIDLLKQVHRYTPNVSILLTKVDLINADERAEIVDFIHTQVRKNLGQSPEIVPYSVRPGYEGLRDELQRRIIRPTLAQFSIRRRAIAARKVATLLNECAGYLAMSLRSAESRHSDRSALQAQVIGEKAVLADLKAELRLILRNAVGGTRSAAAARFETHQREIESRLQEEFAVTFPRWTRSLATLLSSFQSWLDESLSRELRRLSFTEGPQIIKNRLHGTRRQVLRYLQDFRNRLSDRAERVFGVPLHTTEVEIEIHEPLVPDISVGRIFDRSWELLSPVLPIALIQGIVRRHFERKIDDLVYINISRLATQWEESINAALLELGREGERRLDELILTVERLIEGASADRAPAIRQRLEQIAAARQCVEHETRSPNGPQ